MTSPKNSLINECDVIDNFILKRLKRGLSTHILVTGLGGSGKSSFSVRTAERLSKRIKNGIDFKHTDIVDSFLKLLKRITEVKTIGEIIVIEEVSVLFPSRRSMTSDNVAIGRVLDTIRKKRVILLSNAPLFPSVDSHMRSMANVLVECKRVIKTEKLVKSKAWWLQTDPHTAKTYRHRFNRGRYDIMYHYSKQPDSLIWDAYEKDKDKFINLVYLKLKQKAEHNEKKENKILTGSDTINKRNNEIIYRRMVKKQPIKRIAKDFAISTRQIINILADYKENEDFSLRKSENSKEKQEIGSI